MEREARVNAKGAWFQKSQELKAGEDRALGVVLARRRRKVAEVEKRCRAQKSVRSLFHQIGGAYGDGGLAHVEQASVKSAARRVWVKGCREPNRHGNHHVTVLEIGGGSRRRAGVSCRWKAPQVELPASSSRRSRRPDLGGLKWPRSCESAALVNEDATGVSEAQFTRKHAAQQVGCQAGWLAKADQAS